MLLWHQVEDSEGEQRGTQEALHVLCYVENKVGYDEQKRSQFLMPSSSSARPSYVSWVKSGVIISTRRSMTMRASKLVEESDRVSGVLDCGRYVVKRLMRRY